ncbi:hypothetical protein BDV34DRAFT_208133 [Aspergillus parasiticus]|uniref:Uncharacterized protein n=1 Tax=Aspergillus parasiticus TaxID=5067 RepID=A0A5N6E3Z5_ASPPA|nr:hypothetical protein BDV34DRAFT_208133 [Aspergillus parasiticus]
MDAPSSLPVPSMQEHAPGVYLAQPLSQKGVGPGMSILSLSPDIGNLRLENGVPSPLLKWAEEGYAVVAVCPGALQGNQDSIASAIEALSVCENCQPKGKVEIVTSSTAKIVIESGKPLAYRYAAVNTHQFTTPFHPEFDYGIEAVFFETRSVLYTMVIIIQELYINHIPTNYFIFNHPADTELKLISYTVGINCVVDKFIYKFTHDMQIDWLFLGILPMNCKAEIPFTVVINVTALVQVGLMPEYLPWIFSAKLEYRVPGAGRETTEKMRDKNAVVSNQMFKHSLRIMGTSQTPVSTKLD